MCLLEMTIHTELASSRDQTFLPQLCILAEQTSSATNTRAPTQTPSLKSNIKNTMNFGIMGLSILSWYQWSIHIVICFFSVSQEVQSLGYLINVVGVERDAS